MAMNDRSLARTGDAYLDGRVAESLVLRGDISAMNPEDKAAYYVATCNALGLNAASQPFAMLRLNGKEVMYPTRTATDQLAAIHRLSREIIDGPRVDDRFGEKVGFCACRVTHPNGRIEVSIATLPLAGDKSMLPMKLETKAKRRATLSILGLGMLDETEIESIPASEKAASVGVDMGRVRALVSQGFTDARSYDEHEAEASPATALDMLGDDLESAETLDAVKAAWAEHQRAVTAMDEDEAFQGALHTARGMVNERLVKLGLASSPTGADALMKAGDEPELLADFRLAIDVTAESDAPARAIVVAYVAWRERLEKLPKPWPAQAKRYAIQAYSATLAVDEKEGAKQLAAAIKKHDAPPPDGSDPTKAKPRAVTPANDAQGTAGESAGAAGSTAHLGDLSAESPRRALPESERYMASSEAWETNCAEHRSTFALLNSWAKHVPGLRRAGVARERLATSVERYITVALSEGRTADETSAERRFADAERAADYEAAHPTPKARREERTRTERPLRKVA